VTTPKCPICGKTADPKVRPFCSPRCADIDLHRWLTGGYSIARESEEETPGDDTDEEA
jgi:endogenous inhibitor of DNA gyrase (YacG/DUF329 family)